MTKRKTKPKKIKKGFPIHYFSDLFIAAMVLFWIVDNVWESVVASSVTFASIRLSFQAGYNCFDTSMWDHIGSNVAMPLSIGGGLWMIKNSVNHFWANKRGDEAREDFPRVDAPGEDEGAEEPIFEDNESEAKG